MLYNSKLPPFSKDQQLCDELDNDKTEAGRTRSLPGQPRVWMGARLDTIKFFRQEVWAKDLEKIAPKLWILSTLSSTNISPLHRQRVKGREIIVTEEPRLHLVWFYDRIFIKPLPKYLLSYTVWETFFVNNEGPLACQDEIRRAALGFLRTYRYLIQHESDFIIAKQEHLGLIPKDVQWEEFCEFISALEIKDSDVSNRYCYGELRLSRLNLYAPFLLGKSHYENLHGQYGDYFARMYGPILFVFAVVSTVLNSMQVALAAEQTPETHWVNIWLAFRWFSILSLLGSIIVSLCFILLWLWMISSEWVYVLRCKLQKWKEKGRVTA